MERSPKELEAFFTRHIVGDSVPMVTTMKSLREANLITKNKRGPSGKITVHDVARVILGVLAGDNPREITKGVEWLTQTRYNPVSGHKEMEASSISGLPNDWWQKSAVNAIEALITACRDNKDFVLPPFGGIKVVRSLEHGCIPNAALWWFTDDPKTPDWKWNNAIHDVPDNLVKLLQPLDPDKIELCYFPTNHNWNQENKFSRRHGEYLFSMDVLKLIGDWLARRDV